MNAPLRDPGSFRDPSGSVYRSGDRILRTVMPGGASEAYRAARDSGLFKDLAAHGLVLPVEEIERPPFELDGERGACAGKPAPALHLLSL